MRMHRNLHAAAHNRRHPEATPKPQWVETFTTTVDGKRRQRTRRHESMVLVNVTTRVQPAAQAKSQQNGVRAVCAFLDGSPAERSHDPRPAPWKRLGFDPRLSADFTADGVPFTSAAIIRLNADGSAWVLGAQA